MNFNVFISALKLPFPHSGMLLKRVITSISTLFVDVFLLQRNLQWWQHTRRKYEQGSVSYFGLTSHSLQSWQSMKHSTVVYLSLQVVWHKHMIQRVGTRILKFCPHIFAEWSKNLSLVSEPTKRKPRFGELCNIFLRNKRILISATRK